MQNERRGKLLRMHNESRGNVIASDAKRITVIILQHQRERLKCTKQYDNFFDVGQQCYACTVCIFKFQLLKSVKQLIVEINILK